MARARVITSGLRRRGINGPLSSAWRAARNSSTAFFWSAVILSEGIGGIRSWALAVAAMIKSKTSIVTESRIFIFTPTQAADYSCGLYKTERITQIEGGEK